MFGSTIQIFHSIWQHTKSFWFDQKQCRNDIWRFCEYYLTDWSKYHTYLSDQMGVVQMHFIRIELTKISMNGLIDEGDPR